MNQKLPAKATQIEVATSFFEKLYTGEQLDPPSNFEGLATKDRRNLICECGPDADCCGFN